MADINQLVNRAEEFMMKAPYLPLGLAKEMIAALKEHEPVKPTIAVGTWICSKCGHTLESQELIDDKENPQGLIHEMYEYCPQCGRKVKWDEVN